MNIWKRFHGVQGPLHAISSDSQAALAGAIGGSAAADFVGNPQVLGADGAITLSPEGRVIINKGSAAAITIAAPGANMIGKCIDIVTATDFAHVVTFTGTTLMDGTAGLNTTWTATAVSGCGLRIMGVSATRWAVVAFNLGTIAP